MTNVYYWRVSADVSANVQGKFGHSAGGVSSTARRTNAKFVIACGMQLLFTILVMLTRSVMNQSIEALSVYTALTYPCSKSTQSRETEQGLHVLS